MHITQLTITSAYPVLQNVVHFFFLPRAGFLLTLQLSKAGIQTFTVELLSPNDVILS